MIDCYRILGVSPHASQGEIRAAYIARMKVLHPDAHVAAGDGAEAAASEISAAYWQLRTSERRAEHDRHRVASMSLAIAAPRPHPAGSRLIPMPRSGSLAQRRTERASRVLMSAAVGIVIVALAAPAGLFWLAHLNPIEPARASASPIEAVADPRRPLDSVMRAAAADDFALVVRDLGLAGARTFSNRCLAELADRASLSMLDYCIAFDDAAANWERRRAAKRPGQLFFADDQRSGLYREVAQGLGEPEVRHAMLQEAGFFGRAPNGKTLAKAAAGPSAL